MTSDFSLNKTKPETSFGYHDGAVETVISVDDVNRQAQELAETISKEKIASLIQGEPILKIEGLHAGYGKMEILHDFNLQVGKGQSLCMIGPNGAGKSTVLHSIFGFTNIFSGEIKTRISDSERTITKMSPNQKLEVAGISYILQDNSVFPDMTVEENLMMGGYLKENTDAAQESTERIFEKYDRLKARRNKPAKVLSGGERRLLEISRALVMEPNILLVDEPSIGLEPRFIDMVFEILDDLQRNEGKTIIMVEQNAKKGLEFCDIGYVLVSGNLAMADSGDNLLANPEVGRLFLGG
jgi:branched-chain amino acid transport system ATP-binding protein|tara:strand:+ start:586 stop:1476 length:891 start_codon:yes stop_codon:yes gene_type:complete